MGAILPQRISPHILHELLRTRVRDSFGRDTDARIREEDVKPTVLLERFVDYAFHV